MIRQLVRLRDRNQITLPAEIVEKLSLDPGALIELILSPEGDCVELRHAEVVRAGTALAARDVEAAKADIREGRFTTFANPEEFAADLTKSRQQEDSVNIQDQLDELRNQIRSLEMIFLYKEHAVRPIKTVRGMRIPVEEIPSKG